MVKPQKVVLEIEVNVRGPVPLLEEAMSRLDEANLGLATTRQLLEEIQARMQVLHSNYARRCLLSGVREALVDLSSADLEYRTVDE